MMLRSVIIAAIGLPAAVLLGGAQQAQPMTDAPAGCTTKVVDEAGNLDDTQIAQAITKLEATGADVYVRSWQTTPDGSLDQWQRDEVQACPNWQGPDRHTKGNLVTVLYGMDHTSAIFFGPNWTDELQGDVDGIRSKMGDYFRNGDFTGGVVHSLDSIDDDLTPTDWGAIWKWIGIVAAALALIAISICLSIFGRRRYHTWQDAKKERQDVQQQARTARAYVAGSYGDLSDQIPALQPEIDLATGVVDGNDERVILRLKATIDQQFETLTNGWQDANSNPNNDPEAKRTLEGYQQNATTWQELETVTRELQAAVQSVRTLCREAQTKAEQTPDMLAEQEKLVTDMTGMHATFVAQGYHAVLPGTLADISNGLLTAQRHIDAREFGEAQTAIEAVDATRQRVLAHISDTPRRQAGLNARLTAISSVDLVKSPTEAAAALRSAKLRYGKPNWQTMEDMLAKAAALKEGRTPAIEAAKRALNMDTQDWDRAEQLVAGLEQNNAHIAQLYKQVAEECAALDRLAATAKATCDQLAADINSASGKIKGRKGKQGPVSKQVTNLSATVDKIRERLGADKPDYLACSASLTTVRQNLDTALADSKRIHQAVLDEEAEEERRRRDRESSYHSSTVFYGGSSSSSSSSGYDFGGSSGSWGGGGFDGGGSSGSW